MSTNTGLSHLLAHKDDHIIAAANLIADADEQARAEAEARLGRASAIEVWHGARCVARAIAG